MLIVGIDIDVLVLFVIVFVVESMNDYEVKYEEVIVDM